MAIEIWGNINANFKIVVCFRLHCRGARSCYQLFLSAGLLIVNIQRLFTIFNSNFTKYTNEVDKTCKFKKNPSHISNCHQMNNLRDP